VLYEVGGSNSTRPLASDTVEFRDLPSKLCPKTYGAEEVEVFLKDLERERESEIGMEMLRQSIRAAGFRTEARALIASHVSTLLESAHGEQKRSLAELLGLIESPAVLRDMCELLKDASPEVRKEAALRFRGLEPVIKGIGVDSELGELCINTLAGRLEDECSEVAIYSAEDLGYFYNDKAFSALAAVLCSEERPEHLRWAAAIALGRTNKVQAAEYLIDALERDHAITVKQGAILGLGRIAPRVIESCQTERLRSLLNYQLLHGPHSLQGYAAYTLGELGSGALGSLDLLLDAMLQSLPFWVKSNCAISISKLLGHSRVTDSQRNILEDKLTKNLGVARPQGWPDEAYHKWFLVNGAELSALLEMHSLSSQYYLRASLAWRTGRWLALYYEASSAYEEAEAMCGEGDLSGALGCVNTTIRLFDEVARNDAFREEAEDASSGLKFKMILAKARWHMLSAAIAWRSAGLSKEYIADIRDNFEQALAQYSRVDVIGIFDDGSKKLTRAEQELVLGLRELAFLGCQLMELKLLVLDLEERRIDLALGRLRSDMRQFYSRFSVTRSIALGQLASALVDLIKEVRSPKDAPITEVAEDLLHGAREIFARSLPTPGTCPVVTFGSATMAIDLRDSIFGDGSARNPFNLSAERNIRFEVEVSVIRRTKNDQLLLIGLDPPAISRDHIQEIPIHESSYTARPIDYGQRPPSHVATRYVISLEFRNQGCSQPVEKREVYVRIYDPAKEFRETSEKARERERYLRYAIGTAEDELEPLERKLRSHRGQPAMEIRQKIRAIKATIEVHRDQLRQVMSEDHLR